MSAAQSKPGLQVHLAQYKCGVRARIFITSVNENEVTCRRCLAAIAKAAALAKAQEAA